AARRRDRARRRRPLLDRAGRAPRVARDARRVLPRLPPRRGGARHPHRHPGPDGQPPRGRPRSDRQRPRRRPPRRRAGPGRRPRSVIAKNTIEALQAGALYGYASQVDGIVTRIADELGVPLGALDVVATGTLAPLVLEECTTLTEHRPLLTLLGLELVFERNA